MSDIPSVSENSLVRIQDYRIMYISFEQWNITTSHSILCYHVDKGVLK